MHGACLGQAKTADLFPGLDDDEGMWWWPVTVEQGGGRAESRREQACMWRKLNGRRTPLPAHAR
jgi:hypothetical protein